MEYIIGKKLLDTPVNMKVVKMISIINECKGKQIVYKKQPKEVLEKLTEKAVLDFTIDSCESIILKGEEIRKTEGFYRLFVIALQKEIKYKELWQK